MELDCLQNKRTYQLQLLDQYWQQRAERLGSRAQASSTQTASVNWDLWAELQDGLVKSLRADLQELAQQVKELKMDVRVSVDFQKEQSDQSEELARSQKEQQEKLAAVANTVSQHELLLAQLNRLSTQGLLVRPPGL